MSFECRHCGFKNNEIQPGGEVEEKGIRITLTVQSECDLNRQVVKFDYTSVKIVELDFEIPSQSQKGVGDGTSIMFCCYIFHYWMFMYVNQNCL
jgi:zinc finger protein